MRDSEGAVMGILKGGRGGGTARSDPRSQSQLLAGLPARISQSSGSQPSYYFSCKCSFPDQGLENPAVIYTTCHKPAGPAITGVFATTRQCHINPATAAKT